MIKTNKAKVAAQSVQGQISHPKGKQHRVNFEGKAVSVPGTGGISYGVHVGDSAFGMAVDHLEPAVSIKNTTQIENDALMKLANPGNTARVISGDAKGATGYVIGTHGGIDHTIIEFAEEDMDKMVVGDKILVKGYGRGLELTDYPQIKVQSIDPDLLERIEIEEQDGKLIFPVVAKIPAYLMGSGVGSGIPYTGDYDIMTHDKELMKETGIDQLKYGDFVLLEDSANVYGLGGYYRGASTIGIIVHSDCMTTGHGPGVTVILSTNEPVIEGKIDSSANIMKYMK